MYYIIQVNSESYVNAIDNNGSEKIALYRILNTYSFK